MINKYNMQYTIIIKKANY